MISVVVCTYNRSGVLRRMLESFFRQSCLGQVPHELLVVDNNSSDDTRAIVQGFERFASLRYVFEPTQGLSHARNRGLEESQGQIVAFLDDDVLVDDAWLGNLQKAFDETRAVVVGGRAKLVYDAPLPKWFGKGFEGDLSVVDRGLARVDVDWEYGILGLNMAFQRAGLLATGGFDPNLGRRGRELTGHEEVAVIQSIRDAGGRVLYDPDVFVRHIVGADRVTWAYFRRLAYERGKSRAVYAGSLGRWKNLRKVLTGVVALVLRTVEYLVSVLTLRGAYRCRYLLRGCFRAMGNLAGRWQVLRGTVR